MGKRKWLKSVTLNQTSRGQRNGDRIYCSGFLATATPRDWMSLIEASKTRRVSGRRPLTSLARPEFHGLGRLTAYEHEEFTTFRAFITEVMRPTRRIKHNVLPAEPDLVS
jgi:hypothetical protein